ncbi:hypothetical protein DL770_005101 [Monosporascus sp. CRB-9-2]|nr:hypothetical protein DL770_005101 [Monosporascus sp. CRB-9-2]
MNRQRRAHAKSRSGCEQCKERHVKCNEVHPRCLNCERHGIACSFSAPSFTITPLNQDSIADLELLEYWHRHPFPANTSGPGRRSEYDPVRLGFSHHYLLNSILALAALQLFDEDRSQTRWYARAVAHQQAAITRNLSSDQLPLAATNQTSTQLRSFCKLFGLVDARVPSSSNISDPSSARTRFLWRNTAHAGLRPSRAWSQDFRNSRGYGAL